MQSFYLSALFFFSVIYRNTKKFQSHSPNSTHSLKLLMLISSFKILNQIYLIYLHQQNKSLLMLASKKHISCLMKCVSTSQLNPPTNPYVYLKKMIKSFAQVIPIFSNLKPITKIFPRILHHTLHQNSFILPKLLDTDLQYSSWINIRYWDHIISHLKPQIICLYHCNQCYATKIKICTLYSYSIGYCILPSRLMPHDNMTSSISNLHVPYMIYELSSHHWQHLSINLHWKSISCQQD